MFNDHVRFAVVDNVVVQSSRSSCHIYPQKNYRYRYRYRSLSLSRIPRFGCNKKNWLLTYMRVYVCSFVCT